MKRSLLSLVLAICILTGIFSIAAFPVSAAVTDITGIQDCRLYYIRNSVTGKYLEVQGSVNADGTNVRMANYTGGSNQVWQMVRLPYGGYKIKPYYISSTRVLNRSSSGNINIWTDPGGILQEQQISLYRNNGMYTMKVCNEYIIGRASDSNVVTASSYSTAALWCFELTANVARSYSIKESGLFGSDFTGSDSDFKNKFESMGIPTQTIVNGTSANALNDLLWNNVMVFNLHGSPGMLQFYTSDHPGYGIITPGFINDPAFVPVNGLAAGRLILMQACYSGQNNDPDYATAQNNLVNAMYERGAHFVLGWKIDIGNNDVNNWNKAFYRALSEGRTVNDALFYADNTVSILKNQSYSMGDANQVFNHT